MTDTLRERVAKVLYAELARQDEKYGIPYVGSAHDMTNVMVDGETDLLELADAAIAVWEKEKP